MDEGQPHVVVAGLDLADGAADRPSPGAVVVGEPPPKDALGSLGTQAGEHVPELQGDVLQARGEAGKEAFDLGGGEELAFIQRLVPYNPIIGFSPGHEKNLPTGSEGLRGKKHKSLVFITPDFKRRYHANDTNCDLVRIIFDLGKS
jgi:hypothetical protein